MSAEVKSAPAVAAEARSSPLYIGVALVAMATLLFEVTLTRVFAILMWHHFAYMIVALALLGFGASGSLLTALRASDRGTRLLGRVAAFATGFGITVLLAFLLATRVRVDSLEIWRRPASFFGLMLIFTILSVPFLFAGLAIGTCLSVRPRQVGMLYFVDLLGSALGGLGAPWLLGRLETPAVVAVAMLLALLAGAAFALGSGRRRFAAHAIPVVAGLYLCLAFAGGGPLVPAFSWRIPFAPHKGFAQAFFPGGRSARTVPSATAQVDVSAPLERSPLMAADFGSTVRQRVVLRGVTQDGTAPTALYPNAAAIGAFPWLQHSQATTGFLVGAADGERARRAPEVLVIGVGGGVDVMMALSFGAARVTAVEINRAMVRMVARDYAGYIGRLFEDPRVRLVTEDGRAYLRRTRDRYDVIQLSGVDTYTALATGAYTLSESYLYTVEAVEDMYNRLAPGGSINYSRLILTTRERRPRETLRLANIARTALARLGVPDPWRHIAVFQGGALWASTIIHREPLTPAQVQALRDFAQREDFYGLVFDPQRPAAQPLDNGIGYQASLLARATMAEVQGTGSPDRARAGAALRAAARFALGGDGARADAALADAAAALAGPADRPPLQAALRRKIDSLLPPARSVLDFRAEVLRDYETVLRGAASEREAFIAGYYFDLRPSWDDRPFFFDYFKFDRLLQSRRDVKWFEALPEFPVGHAVLLSSLAQIVVLAALLILLPLWGLTRGGAGPLPGRWRFFLYFAALGCGYMFVEISLMQKLNLFLGHPTYSLSVVLSGLLTFSGLGALFSSRLGELSPRLRRGLLVAIVALLALDSVAVDWIVAQAIHLPWEGRVALTLLLLAPTGFALGFPFPLGIRQLERQAPVLIPWGWAVNGLLSVAGSILAILVAMATGFSAVLLTAAVLYGLGFAVVPTGPLRYSR